MSTGKSRAESNISTTFRKGYIANTSVISITRLSNDKESEKKAKARYRLALFLKIGERRRIKPITIP